MKKMLFVILSVFILASCTSVELSPTPVVVPPTDTQAPPTVTPLPLTQDLTADWQEYINTELGYSFSYPRECSFGPMAADCKQSPPEERSIECLCNLNAEDPYAVSLQSFIDDPLEGITLLNLMVQHYDTSAYNPPEGEAWIPWLSEEWAYLSEEMPEEPNLNLGGRPGVRIYTPGSPQAAAAENIFVVKDGRLIKIYLLDVDIPANRVHYDTILSTFAFSP